MAVITDRSAGHDLDVHGRPVEPPASPRKLGAEQLAVTAGQLASGVGNLAFALVAARLLDPAGFAHLSVFLGLYLVLSLPATSLSAATAIDPGRRDAMLRAVGLASLVAAGVVAAMSPILSGLLRLPVGMILGLAAALPATAPLALDRGRLYGTRRHARLVASLLAEPVVRLSAGLALAAGTGSVGAAAGVVIAAYAARETARAGRRGAGRGRPVLDLTAPPASAAAPEAGAAAPPASAAAPEGGARSPAWTAGWTAAAFAVLAVAQNQDLLFANVILRPDRAGTYAALSTLGGAAAFATITIPLVLLPRAVRRERHSLAVAVAMAGVLGAAVTAVGAVAPRAISVGLFGSRYAGMASFVIPYLAAMSLLGVARVVVAHRCATGSPRRAAAVVTVVAAGQAAGIVIWGRSVGTIAATTVASTAALVIALGGEPVASSALRRFTGAAAATARSAVGSPVARAVGAVTVAGLLFRLVVPRGIWLDEATSIHQASMPFGAMLHDLRATDVHPPLYFTVLWATERVLGNGSLAMRLPSILMGALAIPVAHVAARDLWDRRSGMVAAVLTSVAPIMVWYSQEVRMYSMFMLLALTAIWGQARVLRRGRARDWALFVLASGALLWTEYFAVFQVLAQLAVFAGVVVTRRGEDRLRLLVGLVGAVLYIAALGVPLVPFAWHQFIVNQTAGKGFGAPSQVGLAGTQTMSVYTVLANLAWAVVGYHSAAVMAAIVAMWPIGILMALFLLGRNMTDRTAAVVVAVVVPTLMLVGIGLFKRNLFDVRYISGVVVGLLLLLARAVTGSTRSTRMQVLGCVAVVGVLGFSLTDEQVNGSNPRLYDFSGGLHAVDSRYRPGDVLLYSPADLGLVVSYYAPRVRSVPMGQVVGPVVAPGQDVFVMASKTLMHPGEPAQLGQALADLRQQDHQIGMIEKANVTVWVFRR